MEIPVEVTVTAVTVYPDRARVTCRGQVELPQGAHQIAAGNLPLALEPESVRASGEGIARVRIRSVDVHRRHYVETPAAAVQALEQEVQALRDELQALEDRQTVRTASISHLDGLREATAEFAWGLARGRTTAENQAALMRFFEDEETRLRAELRDLDVEERGLRERLEKLQSDLEQLRAARPKQRYEARLEVDVVDGGAFTVEVSYVVTRAGWRPLYDMRLLLEDGPARVALTSLAEVSQNTGQDWTGVQLAVSTARPALNQRTPELSPWYIDVPRPQPRPVRAALPEARGKGLEMAMASDEAMPPMAAVAPAAMPAEIEVAAAQSSGTAVTFVVPGGVDIPGDGTPHKTTIAQSELTPELDFLAVPRHTDAVYRRAKLVNTTPGPLLPGQANLFVGDEFIGRNQLEYTPPQAEMELVLGVEERIVVERELVRRDVDKRLLRDIRQVAYGYEIRLENLLTVPAAVTVEDQYPVSRHEQIKVRLDRVMPEPAEQTDLHIMTWRLELPAGAKQTLRYDFQVEHPRGVPVVGIVD